MHVLYILIVCIWYVLSFKLKIHLMNIQCTALTEQFNNGEIVYLSLHRFINFQHTIFLEIIIENIERSNRNMLYSTE